MIVTFLTSGFRPTLSQARNKILTLDLPSIPSIAVIKPFHGPPDQEDKITS